MRSFLSSLRLISNHSLNRDIERWSPVKVLFFSFCTLLIAIAIQPTPGAGRRLGQCYGNQLHRQHLGLFRVPAGRQRQPANHHRGGEARQKITRLRGELRGGREDSAQLRNAEDHL
jgi:hypothetical protein